MSRRIVELTTPYISVGINVARLRYFANRHPYGVRLTFRTLATIYENQMLGANHSRQLMGLFILLLRYNFLSSSHNNNMVITKYHLAYLNRGFQHR